VNDLDSALLVLRNGDFQSRWEIAKEFSAFGESAVHPLIALLDHPETDEELTWFLVKILGSFQSPEVVLALVNLLDPAQPEDVSEMAAQTLAEMGLQDLESLAVLLDDPVRQPQAVQAIALIDRPEAAPLLINVWSQDPPPKVRALILEALDKFQGREMVPLFLQGLKDESAEVREAAITGLTAYRGIHPRDDLVAQIIPCLADKTPEVADRAARALGLLATSAATTALVAKCCDRETSLALQKTITQALGWAGVGENLEGLVQIWQSLSQTPITSEPLLKEVLTSLSRAAARSEASGIILTLLKTPVLQASVFLKSAAAFSLGRLADETSLDCLIGLLADPDYALRLQVVAALKQLSPDRAYQEIQRRSGDPGTSPDLATGLAIALQEW
jgi:HEAT repeat protein